ncbi:MAG TPA: carboxypeptidase regulatory-like domain-containing protein [Terracidiphilus sp.]|nr:carboxypeptidase regulatory-like domain-containing protein [Terracidiphilus sp.]
MRKRRKFQLICCPVGAVTLAAFAIAAAFAQSAASTRAAPPAQGYRVAGTVVNAISGEPVRGAAVALLTVEDSHVVASTESGDDGKFVMNGLAAAKFQLTASKRGYSTGFYNQHWEFNSAIVTGPGQDTANLVFKLSPSGVIYGVVTGDGGDPVEGAAVILYEKPHRHEPGEKIEQVQNVQTDDTGAYEFANLEPGDYLIAVKARPWYAMSPNPADAQSQETEAQAALDVAYPVTYFDSTTDESSAGAITLTTGAREEADVSLHSVQAVRIAVAAPRKTDGSLARPTLQATAFGNELPLDDPEVMEPGQAGGVMQLAGIAPGHYELTQGDPPRLVDLDATSSQQVDPAAGVPTQAVSGKVETAAGTAYTGRGTAVLEPADGAGPVIQPAAIDRGSFKFDSVPAGAWLIEVMGQETQLPVLAIAPRGGGAQSGNRLLVEDKPLSLVVTVSAGNTRLEGFVHKDGKGLAGAMVMLIPRDLTQIAELARRDQSDSDGSFALLNVAPGQYTLLAIEDAWGMDWFDKAVISRYLPRGMAVTVKDKSEKTLHLDQPVEVQGKD